MMRIVIDDISRNGRIGATLTRKIVGGIDPNPSPYPRPFSAYEPPDIMPVSRVMSGCIDREPPDSVPVRGYEPNDI